MTLTTQIDGRKSMQCQLCDREFTFRRRTARYCSAACRTAAYREREYEPLIVDRRPERPADISEADWDCMGRVVDEIDSRTARLQPGRPGDYIATAQALQAASHADCLSWARFLLHEDEDGGGRLYLTALQARLRDAPLAEVIGELVISDATTYGRDNA